MSTLLGEWGFLDNLEDTSGNDHHATANFTPTYIDGPHPETRGAVFTATGTQQISFGRTGLEPASGGVVSMGWVRVPNGTGLDYVGAFHKSRTGENSTRAGFQVNVNQFRPMSRWDQNANFSDGIGGALTQLTWHHLCVVDSDDRYEWYINGVSVGGASRGGGPYTPSWEDHPWISGDYATDTQSQAGFAISGFRIFQGSLSDAEVVEWMNTPVTGTGDPVDHAVSGTVAGTTTVTGAITADHAVSGTVPASSAIAGAITADYAFSGIVPASSGTVGAITAAHAISGTVAAISAVRGRFKGVAMSDAPFSCPWPIDAESCGLTDLDPNSPLFISSVEAASTIMMRLSAYTIGICETEIRPLNICRECRTWCCGGADSLYLMGPFGLNVWDVLSVRLGPDDYPQNSWWYDRDIRTLWRVPPDVWPSQDEKWSAAGEGEAFVVDVVVGVPPDAWALDVAARLVKELYLSCEGKKCRLPSNVTTVTSQGITVRLRDDEVNTFIPELAAWVHAVNPHGARLPAMVMSPEVSERGRSVSNSGGGCQGARRLG